MDYKKDLFVSDEDLTGRPSKEDRILAALCYAHFLFLAPFLMQKDTEFLNFHMRQGGILYVLFIVASVLFSIILLLTGSVRLLGLGLLTLVVYTCVGVFVGIKAYRGEKHELKSLRLIMAKLKEIMDKDSKKDEEDKDDNYYY